MGFSSKMDDGIHIRNEFVKQTLIAYVTMNETQPIRRNPRQIFSLSRIGKSIEYDYVRFRMPINHPMYEV